jgi:sec-independent protein translocase protein TatB
MDLFGIGPFKLLLILAVLLLVFGPDRLPEMAARAGKLVRDLRSYASEVTGEFGGEIAEIQQHFNGVQNDLRGLGNDLQNTNADLGSTVRDATSGLNDAAPTVESLNAPPPAVPASEKVVSLTGNSPRPRVDDYKPPS